MQTEICRRKQSSFHCQSVGLVDLKVFDCKKTKQKSLIRLLLLDYEVENYFWI